MLIVILGRFITFKDEKHPYYNTVEIRPVWIKVTFTRFKIYHIQTIIETIYNN